MDIVIIIASALLALGLLITIHELGHFWVAKACKVKVLRFSIGFGKAIWSKQSSSGTEYQIGLFPFGGYVKMLDEREGAVPASQKHLAFNTKTVWQRIAIVAAGPIANLLLAVLLYWVMFMGGIQTIIPVTGTIQPDSPAAFAHVPENLEVISINDKPITNWYDVNLLLLAELGTTTNIDLAGKPYPSVSNTINHYSIKVKNWLVGLNRPNPIAELGIEPWLPAIPPIIDVIIPKSPAEKAGFKKNDIIVSVDGTSIANWMALVDIVETHTGKLLSVKIKRGQSVLNIEVTPAIKTTDRGTSFGFVGIQAKNTKFPKDRIRTIQYGFFSAGQKALSHTIFMTQLTLSSIGKMINGLISVSNLSGPITIAKIAGRSAQSGLESFLSFLGMLSISLGVLNLLPIPILDGGHLLFYVIEAICGRPVSPKIQEWALRLGASIILSIMCIALYNDITQL